MADTGLDICLTLTLANFASYEDDKAKWPESVIRDYDTNIIHSGYPVVPCPSGLEPFQAGDDPWFVLVVNPAQGALVRRSFVHRCMRLDDYAKVAGYLWVPAIFACFFLVGFIFQSTVGRFVEFSNLPGIVIFLVVVPTFLAIAFGLPYMFGKLLYRGIGKTLENETVYTLLPEFFIDYILQQQGIAEAKDRAELKKTQLKIIAGGALGGVLGFATEQAFGTFPSKIVEQLAGGGIDALIDAKDGK